MKSIIIVGIVLLSCVAFNEALQCYSHDTCSINCPQLSSAIKTCSSDDNRCYKAAFPGGVTRGCAKDRCNIQVNANPIMANVCCETELCNSGIITKLTLSTLFMMIITFILARI